MADATFAVQTWHRAPWAVVSPFVPRGPPGRERALSGCSRGGVSGFGAESRSGNGRGHVAWSGALVAAIAGIVWRRRRRNRPGKSRSLLPRSRTQRLEQISNLSPPVLLSDEPLSHAESELEKLGYGIRLYRSRPPLLPRAVDSFIENGGGAALLAGAGFLSLLLANLPWTQNWWLSFWATKFGFVMAPPGGVSATQATLSLKGFVNEGLMAIFFFIAGLEIKREAAVGCLRTWKSAALPCLAALGGMVVPIMFYVVANLVLPGGSLAGWSTPMATDIAFALGVLTLFGKNMPKNAGAFLLALATVDDIGAILVIAASGLHSIRMKYLSLCIAICGLLWQMSKHTEYETMHFGLAGVGLWASLIGAGLSAEVAGCITAAAVPWNADPNDLPLKQTISSDTPHTTASTTEPEEWVTLRIDKLIRKLTPFVSLFVLPVFALANLAVPVWTASATAIGGTGTSSLFAKPTPALGLMLGLLIGKPIGIFGASWLSVKAGIGNLPQDVNNKHLAAISILGGIGFTMCLFLVDRSIDPVSQTLARLTVVASSLVMAFAGALYMRNVAPPNREVGTH